MKFKNIKNLDKVMAFSVLIGGLIANGAGTIAAFLSYLKNVDSIAFNWLPISTNLFNFLASAFGCLSFGLWALLFLRKKEWLKFNEAVACTFAFVLFPTYLWKVPAGIFMPYLIIIPITFGMAYDGHNKLTIVGSCIAEIIYSLMILHKCMTNQMALGGFREGLPLYVAILCGFNATYLFAMIMTHVINGHLKRLLEEIEKESFTDELTGLFNRRKLDSDLERKQHTYYAMFDIDFFKKINDTYGHQVGDEALKKLAELAGRYCSYEFRLYRYGGEEFIIASQLDLDSTVEIVKAIICDVRGKFLINGKNVTVSSGIGETIEKADSQLYKAKENGRNQLWCNDREVY